MQKTKTSYAPCVQAFFASAILSSAILTLAYGNDPAKSPHILIISIMIALTFSTWAFTRIQRKSAKMRREDARMTEDLSVDTKDGASAD